MGTYSKSAKIQTLNSAGDLNKVKFGHKFPRRGLKLLYWLANNWIEFDSEGKMMAMTDPKTGWFGFHCFYNKEEILPSIPRGQGCYFEVGNLHASGAHLLPFKAACRGSESNTDRIIVRMYPDNVIGEVYITEHTPHGNSFLSESTYRISRGLIRAIQGWEESDFLQWAGYIRGASEKPVHNQSRETSGYIQVLVEPEEEEHLLPRQSSRGDRCCCTIL